MPARIPDRGATGAPRPAVSIVLPTWQRRLSPSTVAISTVYGYRRKDGKSAQKVIASLGRIPELTAANIRAALEATRQGRIVIGEKVGHEGDGDS